MATPPVAVGANLVLTEKIAGGLTTETISNPIVTTTVIPLITNNADRMELIVFNVGTDDVLIHFDPSLSNTNGFRIPASGGFLVFKVRDDYQLVTRGWYGRANATSSLLTIVEVIRIVAKTGGQQ